MDKRNGRDWTISQELAVLESVLPAHFSRENPVRIGAVPVLLLTDYSWPEVEFTEFARAPRFNQTEDDLDWMLDLSRFGERPNREPDFMKGFAVWFSKRYQEESGWLFQIRVRGFHPLTGLERRVGMAITVRQWEDHLLDQPDYLGNRLKSGLIELVRGLALELEEVVFGNADCSYDLIPAISVYAAQRLYVAMQHPNEVCRGRLYEFSLRRS